MVYSPLRLAPVTRARFILLLEDGVLASRLEHGLFATIPTSAAPLVANRPP